MPNPTRRPSPRWRAKQFLVESAGRVVNTDEFTAQQEWPYSMDKVANPEIYYRVRSDKLQTRSVGVINRSYFTPDAMAGDGIR